MTERLYYNDSYRTEFEATVVEKKIIDGKPAVVLNKTFFYPTGGGQPFDTGKLADSSVLDVVQDENGQILHILTADIPEGVVHGVIDWRRRFDNMQQHSGQHLLSQTFVRLFGIETVSIRIGDSETTIDLDTRTIDQAQIDRAEGYANDVVYENRDIKSYLLDESEIHRVPLRRPPTVKGPVRIVEISDFDYSADGATHCRSTGEIGLIKIVQHERKGALTRLFFKCGKRAYSDYKEKHQLITTAASLLNVKESELLDAVCRNLERLKALQHDLNSLIREHLPYEAQELVKLAQKVGDFSVVAKIFPERDTATLRMLATTLQQSDKTLALLGSTSGERLSLIFARSRDIPVDVSNLLRNSLSKFDGRGGGKPDFAQGGGPASYAQSILDHAVWEVIVAVGQ